MIIINEKRKREINEQLPAKGYAVLESLWPVVDGARKVTRQLR